MMNILIQQWPVQQSVQPILSGGEEQQTDVQAPIDVPSQITMSRKHVLVVPNKVPKNYMEMASQAYEEFSDLFTSGQFGPERPFQAAVAEHPISMLMSEPKSFQTILKQPPERRKLWFKTTESELDNLISNETFKLEQPQSHDQ
eukprot:553783-Ditylum_brightwellii.AAC.1